MRNWTALVRASLLLGVAMLLVGSHFGCNTFEGAGRDVERTGEEIQDVARDAKD
jgi:predicted small secreted protein